MTYGELLTGFKGQRVVVVGDVMIDEYLYGDATRISPEAPVMVVRHGRTERLPGGAANVARNLQALGASVHLIGVVGDDPGAEMLEACLREQGLDSVTLVKEGGRATTRKVRVLADATHQTLRIDFEDDHPVGAATASEIVDSVRRQTDGAQVLLLSDYVKGALTEEVVQGCIEAVTVPVVANAKPESIERYRGIELVSVNRAEATKALGRSKPIERSEAVAAARELRNRYEVGGILLTLGHEGMVAVGREVVEVPARRVEVYDTAGAGDTVIATVALGIGSAGFRREVFELAAETAACVVRHVGVATPSPRDLAELSR